MARGFLAGSSWLLHIKQIYIESRKDWNTVLKGVQKTTYMEPSIR